MNYIGIYILSALNKRNSYYAVQISYEEWLKCRNMGASKKTFMAIGILVSEFELL